jgi:hypothetical protein
VICNAQSVADQVRRSGYCICAQERSSRPSRSVIELNVVMATRFTLAAMMGRAQRTNLKMAVP